MRTFAGRLALLATLCTPATAVPQAATDAAPLPGLTLAGRARVSAVYDVEVVGPYLYSLEQGIIRVMDARDPGNIREIDSLVIELPRTRMHLRGNRLYLVGFGAPLGIVDVSNPSKPRWIGEDEKLVPAPGRAFELAGEIALMVRRATEQLATSPNNGRLYLDVLDLSKNPSAPRSIGTVDLDVRANGEYGGVTFADGRAFVLVTRPLGGVATSQLIVVDVRHPTRPTIERRFSFPTGSGYRNLEVKGDLMYVIRTGDRWAGNNGLAVFRIGDTSMELLGEATSRAIQAPMDLALRGDVVYMTTKGSPTLVTINVEDPRHPRITQMYGDYDYLTAGLGMAMSGDRLYVTGDNGPVSIFDIRVPDAPRFLGRWLYEGGASAQVIVGGSKTVLTGYPDLFVIDVSNPASPRRTARYETMPKTWFEPWQWTMVAGVRGSMLVLAYGSKPPEVIDMSTPTQRRPLGTFEPTGLVNAIAVGSTHAFIGYRSASEGRRPELYEPSSQSGRGGIEVRDLRQPQAHRPSALLEFEQAVTDVALANNRLVAAHQDGSLTIVDVTVPEAPRVAGRLAGEGPYAKTGRSTRVALSSDARWAFLSRAGAQSSSGTDRQKVSATLSVIDLSDEAHPRVATQLPLEGVGGVEYPIAMSGARLAVLLGYAGSAGGVLVFDVHDPNRPVAIARQQLPRSHFGFDLAVDGSHVYVGALEAGMLIYALPQP